MTGFVITISTSMMALIAAIWAVDRFYDQD